MSKIATAVKAREAAAVQQNPASASISVMVSSLLDREGYRRRFDDLLGRRAPQFVSSIVSMVNADEKLQEAFRNAPLTVIQSALKAATYDLPIDTTLGYAYIVPFRNHGTMEATFILGYKGMLNLALRTGVYKTINVVDVRAGELKHYNRLTEEVEIDFVEDEDEREALPIVGWVGYFRLINGTEKTIYMTRKQIEAHERKHRKGQYMGKGWREDFEVMARKTVLRRLLGTWGIMSIDYQRADAATVAAADAIATGQWDGEDIIIAEAEETPQEALTASEEASPAGGIDGVPDEPLPWDPEEGIR